jgi:hypothetical protein
MLTEDAERINTLIQDISNLAQQGVLNSGSASQIDEGNIVMTALPQDLEYLVQRGSITKKNRDEIVSKFGESAIESIPFLARYNHLSNLKGSYESNITRLDKELSCFSSLVMGRKKRGLKKNELVQNESQLMDVDARLQSLDELSERFPSIRDYVLTSEGVYVRLNQGISQISDISPNPIQGSSSGSQDIKLGCLLSGELVDFYYEPDISPNNYPPADAQRCDTFELVIDTPYPELTLVDTTEVDPTKILCPLVMSGIKQWTKDNKIEFPLYIGELRFPDRGYSVWMGHPSEDIQHAHSFFGSFSSHEIVGTTDYGLDELGEGVCDDVRHHVYKLEVEGKFTVPLSLISVRPIMTELPKPELL